MLAGSAGSVGATSNAVPIGASVASGVARGVFVAVVLTLLILYLRWQRQRRILENRKRDHGTHLRAQPQLSD
jgi:uncharacterized membrane protein